MRPRAPAARTLLTREQAISTAMESASSSAPEVSGALVPPHNIHAEQLLLGQALQLLPGGLAMPSGYTADMPVWVVTMDGLWAGEAQAPGIAATQVPFHHYICVLDAFTGVQIESSLRP